MHGPSPELAAWRCYRCQAVVHLAARPLHCGKCDGRNSFAPAVGVAPPRRARSKIPYSPSGSTSGRPDEESVAPGTDASEATSGAEGRSWRWGAEVRAENVERASSGWEPWARVTCELPRKHLVMLGGPRGTGKTRTMLTVAAGVVRTMRRPVVYFLGDEGMGVGELRAYARELGLDRELQAGGIALVEGPELEVLRDVCAELSPALIVVDALKSSKLRGARCTANTDAERDGMDLLLELAVASDAALLAMLHMHSDQRDYSVGGQVQQKCSAIVRLDLLNKTDDGELPKIRLWVDGKNRFQRGRRRTALLTMTEHDGRVEPHPEDKP